MSAAFCRWLAVTSVVILAGPQAAHAGAVTFTKLSGLTGGNPALTAVYRADLSAVGLEEIVSISITDNSFALGGAGSQFSGFDLDAIMLSTSSVGTAGEAAGLVGLAVFDFSPAGTFFTPGAQRAPPDPKLFGTGSTGNTVDNSVATLGAFDANATIDFGAFGFLSMGDGGQLAFNLTQPVSTAGLFLYISEVGDNGEVAAGSIEVSDRPVGSAVPEPSALALTLVAGLIAWRATRCRQRPKSPTLSA
ncbi:MAG: PEP-CTERM sorting domain-containing protein [Planctomycetes bacterium]|nr:PEP-CTERM sorting domain-containing protein [Planctomycetota bacterium]